MLMFAGKVHHMSHFSLGDLVCVDAALADPVVVNMQHDSGRSLVVLVEKPLEHMHHEFHRSVIVVENEHTIEARPLGLRLGLGDDRGSRPRGARFPALFVIVRQPRLPPSGSSVGALVGSGLAGVSAEDGGSDHGRANHGASHDTVSHIIMVKQAACQTAPMRPESLMNFTLADRAPVGRASAADLKSLLHLPANSVRNFKSKSGTRIIELLVPLCFRSSCQSVLKCITSFGNGALDDGQAYC